MPCNFEVKLITRLGVIALFSSFVSSPDPKGHVRYCHHLASVVRCLALFGQAVSEEKICLPLANQKKKLILAAMFVGQMERNGETL
jgi:hypothetical protein